MVSWLKCVAYGQSYPCTKAPSHGDIRSCGGKALCIFDLDTRWRCGQLHTPPAVNPGNKCLVPIGWVDRLELLLIFIFENE